MQVKKWRLVQPTKLSNISPSNMVNQTKARMQIKNIREATYKIEDIIYKDFDTSEGPVTIIFSDSLTDKLTLQMLVYIPLGDNIQQIHQMSEMIDPQDLAVVTNKLVKGETLVYFYNQNLLCSIDTYNPPTRNIGETETETTIIGPQDYFTESLDTNISLIRRRIKNPVLKNENMIIGEQTQTKISILYMDNIVDKKLLNELKKRIDSVNQPRFTDISELMQIIEDNPFSPFPQYYLTIKPDTIAHYLADGRIVVMMDNSQGVMICPTSFLEMFFSIEDEYNRWSTASLIRVIRFFGFFLTIMITPTYISALSFHQEILPYELLLNIQESRLKVPFSPLFEVLFIELIIEVLKEAGTRMPSKIGQTIGIVGGIVIGTAAVEAGLVSNILIVIVAGSALLSFLAPTFQMGNTSRLIRYIFIILAGLYGLYGQMLGFAWLIIHLVRLRSLGVPFVVPVIPRRWSDLKDSIIRIPTKYLKKNEKVSEMERD